jgi:acetyl-CoA carboxylase biotin carboxyl carrier protein
MDIKDIKRLLDAVASADISEFAYETGEFKLSVKRGASDPAPVVVQQALAPVAAPVVDPAPQQQASQQQPAESEAPAASHLVEVTAPIVGTFYTSSAPDAPSFVKVGDRVGAGTVLCIIEAMKLMNEIEAETAGTVAEVLVSNEDPVEYGQVLFRIDPG